MDKIVNILLAIGIIFVLEYEAYYWWGDFNPCKSDGTCFAIERHYIPARTIYCDSIECVERNIEATGIEHFIGAYQIEYDTESATIKHLKIKYKATVD